MANQIFLSTPKELTLRISDQPGSHFPFDLLPVALFKKIIESLHLSANMPLHSTCKFFKDRICFSKEPTFCVHAAGTNSLALVQWGRALGYPLSASVCEQAGSHGNFEMLKWVHGQGVTDCGAVTSWAASNGHFQFIKDCPQLRVRFSPMTTHYVAKSGDLEMLMWLRTAGSPFNVETCKGAAIGGHLNVLQWLRSESVDCPWDQFTCAHAAEEGHLELLKWAIDQEAPHGDGLCLFAARNNQRKILEYVIPLGADLKFACTGAVEGGHLDLLQWLKLEKNAPMDTNVCEEAARRNNLPMLAWILHEGVGEGNCFTIATARGYLPILQWAAKNNRELKIFELIATAFNYKQGHIIEWLGELVKKKQVVIS